jgi:hypothetical protein
LGQPHATFLSTSEEERMRKNLVVFVVALCVGVAAECRLEPQGPRRRLRRLRVHHAELTAAEAVNLRLLSIDGGVRAIYCFPTRNYLGSIHCDRNMHIAYGTKLIDGGSHGDDGGEPLAAIERRRHVHVPRDGRENRPAQRQAVRRVQVRRRRRGHLHLLPPDSLTHAARWRSS